LEIAEVLDEMKLPWISFSNEKDVDALFKEGARGEPEKRILEALLELASVCLAVDGKALCSLYEEKGLGAVLDKVLKDLESRKNALQKVVSLAPTLDLFVASQVLNECKTLTQQQLIDSHCFEVPGLRLSALMKRMKLAVEYSKRTDLASEKKEQLSRYSEALQKRVTEAMQSQSKGVLTLFAKPLLLRGKPSYGIYLRHHGVSSGAMKRYVSVTSLFNDYVGGCLILGGETAPEEEVLKAQVVLGKETEIWRVLLENNVPHIPKMLKSARIGNEFRLEVEHCNGGSLFHWIRQEDMRLSSAAICKLAQHVLESLSACHKLGFLHLDVKPGNILCKLENPGQRPARFKEFLLCDFGLSHRMTTGAKFVILSQAVGTRHYVAPEFASERIASDKVDIWSLGVTLFAARVGRCPFPDGFRSIPATDSAIRERYATVMRGVKLKESKLDEWILSLVQLNPAKRPSAAKALQEIKALAIQLQ
jgi:serine/threonine protein kinase